MLISTIYLSNTSSSSYSRFYFLSSSFRSSYSFRSLILFSFFSLTKVISIRTRFKSYIARLPKDLKTINTYNNYELELSRKFKKLIYYLDRIYTISELPVLKSRYYIGNLNNNLILSKLILGV